MSAQEPEQDTLAAAKPPADPEYPWYALNAEEKENGDSWTYKIRIDSDEGRAYEKLTSAADRLAYMRKHHDPEDSHENVCPTWRGWVDEVAGKHYSILIRSPEGDEIEKLVSKLSGPDGWPPEGTKERREIEDYYREHAHEVVDLETRAVLVPSPNPDTKGARKE